MILLVSDLLFADSLKESLYDPLPPGLFSYKFDFDPTLVAFIFLALFYAKALRSRHLKIRQWQVGCFYLGVFISILALSPPVDPLSDRLFFMHMIQHMMITALGVPLMLLGVPYYALSADLAPRLRRSVLIPLIRLRPLRVLMRLCLHPLVALALFEGNYWFWHVPFFYNLALLNDWYHLLEHACMAGTAFLLWRNIIDVHPLRSPIPIGFRLLYLVAIEVLNSILSAALTFSSTIWYAYEGIPSPLWWSTRWDHLEDQRLGGLIMWVPGGILSFVTMSLCFLVWVKREEKKQVGI